MCLYKFNVDSKLMKMGFYFVFCVCLCAEKSNVIVIFYIEIYMIYKHRRDGARGWNELSCAESIVEW